MDDFMHGDYFHVTDVASAVQRAHDDTIRAIEGLIRDLAAEVLNAASARKTHPSYGYTKTSIRNSAERMEGAIATFQIVTGQAANAHVTQTARFFSLRTIDQVTAARAAVESL